MRKILLKITAALFAVLFLSCEDVFHNDALDYMWRLDSVEYLDSLDFYGKPCLEESKEGLWISFARDLVRLESSNSDFSAIGILIDKGDYLTFDFSMYNEENWKGIDEGLNIFGIGSRVSTFNVTELNRKHLILTGRKTVLKFTRW